MSQKEKALSLADKAKQYSFQNRFEEFLSNENGQSRPWVVELDPLLLPAIWHVTVVYASLLNQGGFKRDKIKELAKEFVEVGVKAVVLIGGGEPMAHPEFGTLVDYFYKNDIHVGVTSNGTLINKYVKSLAYHTKSSG